MRPANGCPRMMCRMRPRKPRVSDEAPTTATAFGHSIDIRSGLAEESSSTSAQPQPASDDAAQHFRRAALDRQLRRDGGRECKLLLEADAVRHLGFEKCGKLAH